MCDWMSAVPFADMSARPRSPLIVVDWNFLQSAPAVALRRSRLRFPKHWDFLIPESASHEVLEKAGTDRGSAEQYLRKLVGFCREFKNRFWLAKSNGRVCELPARTMRLSDLADIQATHRIRRN